MKSRGVIGRCWHDGRRRLGIQHVEAASRAIAGDWSADQIVFRQVFVSLGQKLQPGAAKTARRHRTRPGTSIAIAPKKPAVRTLPTR